MRTSRKLLKQVRRALLAAFFFSGFVNLLMLTTPLYTLQVFESVVPAASVETLALLTAMAATAILTLALIELARDAVLLRAGLWLDHTLGQHMLENGLKLGTSGAELRQDAKSLAMLRSFLSSPAIIAVFEAPWVPIFVLALMLLHPMIGAVALVSGALLFSAAVLHGLLTSRVQLEGARSLERSEHWFQAVTGNAQLTGALGLARGAAEQWELFNRAHVANAYSQSKRAHLVRAFARSVRIGAQIAIYAVGAWLVIRGELTPGALVASAILLARALSPLEQAVNALRATQMAFQAYRRLKALPPDARLPSITSADSRPSGRITLADVTFYHPGRKSPALRNIGLDIAPGQCVGLVGPNGAGKSTLAALIAGAVLPTVGVADLDGIPIAKWQRGDTPPLGYLPDEPALVDGTVHDNIARFQDASLMSVANAAMRAGVHETLAGLQQGYDTQVGPGGCALALRERRAVALARAMHGDPTTIVLDEPEIGLDGASLRRLFKVLEKLKADGVSLVIATQDPRLLSLTDVVAVLNDGALQSIGPAHELSRKLEAQRAAAAATMN